MVEFLNRDIILQARFFVIKSYTEEDVHKSLKYEIWSSTDPGNKRLDKAFRENGTRGPIYLFFSVNTSGHFCGMAEMLTPVSRCLKIKLISTYADFCSLITPVRARFGPKISGKVSLRFGGYL